MIKLQVELNPAFVNPPDNNVFVAGEGDVEIMTTPPIDENFWLLRVKVSDKQAVVAFPKFCTIGIGFQVEDADWNLNLPYRCDAKEIYKHIVKNKGDHRISRATCIIAIKMLQKTISAIKQEID